MAQVRDSTLTQKHKYRLWVYVCV